MSMSPPPPPPPPMPPGGAYTASTVPGSRPLAEPGMRVLARFLDIVILIIIGLILGAIVGAGSGVANTSTDMGDFFVAAILGIVIGFVYDAVMTKTKGGTPMKLAFGMRVVRADTGGPVEWSHAIIRWAVPGIFGLIPLLGGLVSLVVVIVSLVFIFTKPMRQAVWDLAAKTIVVSVR